MPVVDVYFTVIICRHLPQHGRQVRQTTTGEYLITSNTSSLPASRSFIYLQLHIYILPVVDVYFTVIICRHLPQHGRQVRQTTTGEYLITSNTSSLPASRSFIYLQLHIYILPVVDVYFTVIICRHLPQHGRQVRQTTTGEYLITSNTSSLPASRSFIYLQLHIYILPVVDVYFTVIICRHLPQHGRQVRQTTTGEYLITSNTSSLPASRSFIYLQLHIYILPVVDVYFTVIICRHLPQHGRQVRQTTTGEYLITSNTSSLPASRSFIYLQLHIYILPVVDVYFTVIICRHLPQHGRQVRQTTTGEYLITSNTSSLPASRSFIYLQLHIYILPVVDVYFTVIICHHLAQHRRQVRQTTTGKYLITSNTSSLPASRSFIYLQLHIYILPVVDVYFTVIICRHLPQHGRQVRQTTTGKYLITSNTSSLPASRSFIYLQLHIYILPVVDVYFTVIICRHLPQHGRQVRQTTTGKYLITSNISSLPASRSFIYLQLHIYILPVVDVYFTVIICRHLPQHGRQVRQITTGKYLITCN